MKRVSIDSIGEEYSSCEDDNFNTIYIKNSDLPKNASEGDILQIDDNGKIKIDIEETKKRKAKIIALQKKIRNS